MCYFVMLLFHLVFSFPYFKLFALKVVDVDNVRQKVTLKLIPRIDLPALAAKLVGTVYFACY